MLYQPDPGPLSVDTVLGNYVQRELQKLSSVFQSDPNSEMVVSDFWKTVLDDPTAVAALTTLGFSTFVQTLLNDTTDAAFQTTLGLDPLFANRLRVDAAQGLSLAQMGQGYGNLNGRGLKNWIDNGNAQVNQVGFSTNTASGIQMHDRWRAGRSASTVWTINRNDFGVTAGALAGIQPPTRFGMQMNITNSGSGDGTGAYGLLYQNTELDVVSSNLKTYTLSFDAVSFAGATGKLGVSATQDFGAGGSPSTSVQGIGAALHTIQNGVWARFDQLITFPSISSKTLGTDEKDHIVVEMWGTGGSLYNARHASMGFNTCNIGITNVSLTEGDNRAHPQPYQETDSAADLARFQRYFQLKYMNGQEVGTAAGQDAITHYIFNPPMIGTPNCTVYAAGTLGNCVITTDVGSLSNLGGYTQFQSTIAGGFFVVGRLLGFDSGF